MITNKPTYEELLVEIENLKKILADKNEIEQSLEASQEKFRLMVMNSPDTIIIQDINGITTFISDHVETLTGYSPSFFIGKNIPAQLIYPDDFEKCTTAVTSLQAGNEVVNLEYRFRKSNGEVIWVQHTARPFFVDGTISGIQNNIREITKQKSMEKELTKTKELAQESEAIFNQFLKHSPIYVFFKDDQIRTVRLSENYEKMLGMSIKDLLGKSMNDLFPSDLAKSMVADDMRILQEGKVIEIEETLNGKNYYTMKFPINIEGKPRYLAGFTMDITERKQAENERKTLHKELAYTKTLLNAAFEQSPVPMALATVQDYTFQIINTAAADFLGINSSDYVGKQLDKVEIPWSDHSADGQPLQIHELPMVLALKGIATKNIEILVVRKDGTKRWELISGTPIYNAAGELIAGMIVFPEITELKHAELLLKEKSDELFVQNEEYSTINEELNETNIRIQIINEQLIAAKEKAEENDKLKSAFLANMSHEIRTPLNAVLGFADLLANVTTDSHKVVRFANIIKQRGNDLLSLINDILDISKIQANQLELHLETTDINQLLDETYAFFNTQNEFISSNPNIQFFLTNKLNNYENYVYTDHLRLKQVLINIVSNALKYTNQGKVELACYHVNSNLQFRIKDTGIGIAPEQIPLVFESFRQLNNIHATKTESGTGLGLAICKGIITLMNGTITITSQENVGTEFIVSIPYYLANQSKQSVEFEVKKNFLWQNKTILIVEDDAYSITFLKEMLEATSANLIVASTANRALEIMQQYQNIDLILMDIRLPDGNGDELTTVIRKTYPYLPIIAQTANAMETDRIRCLNAGCNDYIAKPIQQKKLLEILQDYLS